MKDKFEAQLRVQEGLMRLTKGLMAFVAARMEKVFGAHWLAHASRARGLDSKGALDSYALLKTMIDRWREVFVSAFPRTEVNRARNFLATVFEARNDLAHRVLPLQDDEALRYLDAIHQLLRAVDAPTSDIADVKQLYDLQRHSGIGVPAPIAQAVDGASRRALPVGEDVIGHSPDSSERPRRSGTKSRGTTELGHTNRNNQNVVRRTNLPGTDHNQRVYVLRCNNCQPAHEYGANGADIFQRRCPKCGGGAPGLAF